MKRNRTHIYRTIIALFFIFSFLVSCDKYTDIGLELLPTEDLISIRAEIFKDDISAYTFSENRVKTDETQNSLLGSFIDPVFGAKNINFAAQYRLIEFPDFGDNPTVDSVKLFLYYNGIYGDTVTYQRFKVYELESGLDVDDTYYQDVDLKALASTQVIGEREYLPRVRIDSASSDTLYQLITIPIDNSLGEKLISADSATMVSNDLFLEYFKGILIETEPVTEVGGTILSLEATYSGSFLGSAIALYFSNDTSRIKFEGDTSFIMPYLISPFSARVNSIATDYTGTPFEEYLDSEEHEDSLIYVQAAGGLKSKIVIDDLSSWKDSLNTAINKAELIFQIDTTLSQIDIFPPPNRLYFSYIDTSGIELLPDDYNFSTSYYGGILNKEDYTYRFNITQHLQSIIEGKSNLGFFLTTGRIADRSNRVILKGSRSKTGIKLIVTYSKFNS